MADSQEMTDRGPSDENELAPHYLAEGADSNALNPDELFEEEVTAEAEEPAEPVASEAEVDAALEEVAAGGRRNAARLSLSPSGGQGFSFPRVPGVYLMKDAAGRVIYVGKAKNLQARAGSYFTKQAREEYRTRTWVHEIADADCIECESEVDALLMESRLIKDIQPPHNKELKDDKTFPYLMITSREDYPRMMVTRQPVKNMRLFGPFASAGAISCAGAGAPAQSFSFAPAPSISRNRMRSGAGSGLACSPASSSARRPATCGSARRTTSAILSAW